MIIIIIIANGVSTLNIRENLFTFLKWLGLCFKKLFVYHYIELEQYPPKLKRSHQVPGSPRVDWSRGLAKVAFLGVF